MIILAQAKLDGTRWQVVPAYLCTVTCTGLNALGRVKGVRLPKIVCRLVALAGAAGAAVSTLAGVFAPVFPMPKPTGPYRVGKTTRLWIDRNRRSWLLKTKRKLGAQALPEHRMMMVNIWYPAAREDDGSGKDSQPPWPADEEAEARFAERAAGFAAVEETAANSTPRRVNVLKKQREETAKHQARFEKKRAEAKKSGRLRRAHWLDPTLATTLAESFYLPGWVVDYFRLVKMDAMEDARDSSTATPSPGGAAMHWTVSESMTRDTDATSAVADVAHVSLVMATELLDIGAVYVKYWPEGEGEGKPSRWRRVGDMKHVAKGAHHAETVPNHRTFTHSRVPTRRLYIFGGDGTAD